MQFPEEISGIPKTPYFRLLHLGLQFIEKIVRISKTFKSLNPEKLDYF